jgi:hypothetical protein
MLLSQNEAIIAIQSNNDLKFHTTSYENYLAWNKRNSCVSWFMKTANIDIDEAKIDRFSKMAEVRKFIRYWGK